VAYVVVGAPGQAVCAPYVSMPVVERRSKRNECLKGKREKKKEKRKKWRKYRGVKKI